MSTCFKHTMFKSVMRMTFDKRMRYPLSKHSLCTGIAQMDDYDCDEMESSQKESEIETGAIDYDWEPEHRYHDFLKSYCTKNDLDDTKWKDIAAKLDTVSDTLQSWVQRVTCDSDLSHSSKVEFAQLTDLDGEAQKEAQILFSRPNLCVDLYWPTSFGAIPALHSLVLMNNKYIACVMKHLAVTHLRSIIVAQITWSNDLNGIDDPNKWRKHVLNQFPMMHWEPVRNTNDIINDAYDLVGSRNIIALGNRFKVPLIKNGVISSAGGIIETDREEENPVYIQSNACVKQKLPSISPQVQPQVFWSGIKCIDLMNPLVKHGINVIITPKGTRTKSNVSNVFKDIARMWSQNNNTIYADIFEDNTAAIQTRNEIYCNAEQNMNGTLTMVAGTPQDSDWFKLQTVITAATLSKNSDEPDTTLFICPNGNAINQSINNLHRACCGALSHLKFQHNDDIGHKPYDWIKPRNKRQKPQPAADSLYLNYGIEPVLNGATYIIGLEMDPNEISDTRIQPAAYFPWSDSVTILNQNDDECTVDVAHSSSKVLSETAYGFGLRRLYSDYYLVSQTESSDHNGCVALWNDIKHCDTGDICNMLADKYDHDGNPLLNMKHKTQHETGTEKECNHRNDGDHHNPLIAILNGDSEELGQDLMKKLNKLHQLYVESASNAYDAPEILIRSKFDHGGFVKCTKVNIQIELYTDHKLKYGMGIGAHCVLFINDKCVKIPQHYGYEKKKKNAHNSIDYVEEQELELELEHDINSAFQRLSSHDTYDAQQQFGVNILRYEKGKASNRYDFLQIVGELKADIYDICIFIFGSKACDAQTNIPFLLRKRVGPDALPLAATRKKKKKTWEELQTNPLQLNESNESIQHMMETLKRKEFVLKERSALST